MKTVHKYIGIYALVVVLSLMYLARDKEPSRYRVIIWNETGQPLKASMLLSRNPINTEGISFDDIFRIGAPIHFGDRLILTRPIIEDFNYFYVGIKNNEGNKWVVNQQFEDYMRPVFDISEGLRIDYFLELDGTVQKKYWE